MNKYIKLEDIKDSILELKGKVFLDRKTALPILETIAGLPKIEIVRCKECIHCLDEVIEDTMPIYIYCGLWKGETEWDNFCSYGERKDNE